MTATTTTKPPMVIIELRAENVKRLRAVSIQPDGAIVEIAGKNKQGKTSILDAMWWGLAGTRAVQAEPIRQGAEKALIELDLGPYKVRRTFARKKDGEPEYTTTLRVETADGLLVKEPQGVVTGFLDALSFDPLAFLRAKPQEQFDLARRFVPDIDFEAYDRADAKDVADRRDWNRDAQTARGGASLIEAPADFKPIDEKPLLDALTSAADDNDEIAERRRRRVELTETCVRQDAEGERLRQESEELSRQAAERLAKATEMFEAARAGLARLAAAQALPEPVDTAALRQALDEARAHNALGARAEEKARLLKRAGELEAMAAEATARIAGRAKQKQDAVAAAEIPVAGLAFGEGCITLNGKPFEQASDAEQLEASVAVAMAGNPQLRVIRVRDGSLLDRDAMALLGKLAAAKGFQIWIERVEGDGKGAFIIEDGAVKGRV